MINKKNRNSRDDKSTAGDRFSPSRSKATGKPNKFQGDQDSKKSTRAPRRDGDTPGRNQTSFDKPSSFSRGSFKKESSDRQDRESFGGSFKGKRTFREDNPRASKGKNTFESAAPRERGPYKKDSSERPRRNENFGSSLKGKRDFKEEGGRAERDRKSSRNPDANTSDKWQDTRPFRLREKRREDKYEEDRGEKITHIRSRKGAAKEDELIRLNRYIANSGICSRRKADELISAGVITVNGQAISELGHKINPAKDEIRYNGELLKREKRVYVLLNKPKDYITTTDDPQERRTVMQLVEKASRERIYPVGRLDRNTTGLLLMTNDGDLAEKLSHPRNGITKIYHVELNKNLTQGDFNKIEFGLTLEDGDIKPDSISYVAGASKREIGIQIHSGKNRIVRRIFEHLGYEVVKLDRVVYGNLTKKDLPRGRWRYLEEHELIQIKHLIR